MTTAKTFACSLIGFAAVTLALGTAAPALAQDAQAAVPARATSLTVTTDIVREESVATEIAGNGIVAAWQEVAVGAQTGGLMLEDVFVVEGERIEKGQLIARLDSTLLRAQMAEQDAAVRAAEAQLANAQAANARAERLNQTGAISAETSEERATALATAAASLDQAKAVRATLDVQLARTEIAAPFAGIVSARPAVPGGIVQAGTEIARIQRDGVLEAWIKVPEQKLGPVALGDPATLTGPDGATLTATVSALPETVDMTNHLAAITLRLPPDSGLKAGMFVRGTIRAGASPRLTIAQSALTWSDGKAAVFAVASDGTVSRRHVEAGARSDGRIAVSGDIRAGEAVAAQGAGFLQDGNRVRVVENEPPADEAVR